MIKQILFVCVIVLVLVCAGVVLARPVDQDGNPVSYPVEVTVEPYPIYTVIATDTPNPEPTLTDSTLPEMPKPIKTQQPALQQMIVTAQPIQTREQIK